MKPAIEIRDLEKRYGFFAVSDVPPGISLAVVGLSFLLLAGATLLLLRSGHKLRG